MHFFINYANFETISENSYQMDSLIQEILLISLKHLTKQKAHKFKQKPLQYWNFLMLKVRRPQILPINFQIILY